MKQKDIVAACVLLVVVIGYGYQTTLLPARTLPNTPDPSFFPWINTILLGVLSFALLIQGILRPTKKGVMQSTLGTRTVSQFLTSGSYFPACHFLRDSWYCTANEESYGC